MNNNSMNPITEDDIANYLANTPDFFARHAELLGAVQLSNPHGGRAVSLQERQAEMLRERIKSLEHRIMDMVRAGNENVVIADRLQRWTRQLFMTAQPEEVPAKITSGIEEVFVVPQVAIRVWGVAPNYTGHSFAQGVSDDIRTFASSLTTPYCGVNSGFEAASWLPTPASAMSLSLIALHGQDSQTFGLLVLGSPDAHRFNAEMGTDFLERIAEISSAALWRLRPKS